MCGIAGIVASDRLHPDERARLLDSMGPSTGIAWR
jgi:hypothetical protein